MIGGGKERLRKDAKDVPFESTNDVSVILVPAKRMILGNAGMTRNAGLGAEALARDATV